MNNVIKDIEHQINCIKEGNLDEMWDVLEVSNWEAMLDALKAKYSECNKELLK